MAARSVTRKGTAIAVPSSEPSRRGHDAMHTAQNAADRSGAHQQAGPTSEVAAAAVAKPPSSERLPEPRPLPKRSTPGTSAGPSRIRMSSVSSNATASGSRAPVSGTHSYASASATPLRRPGMLENAPNGLRQASTVPSWRAVPIPLSVIGGSHETQSARSSGVDVNASLSTRSAASEEANNARMTSKRAASVASSASAARARGKPPRGSRPKAPPSAYVLFSQQRRGDVERSAATASGPSFKVNAAVRRAWDELDKQVRSTFEADAAQRRTEYNAAMDAFREIYGEKASASGSEGNDATRGRKGAKRSYRPGEPIPPKNAYFLFKQQYEQQATDQSKSSASISQAWHALAESERAEFKAQADEARRKFEAARVAWRQENASDAGEDCEGAEDEQNTPTMKHRDSKSLVKRKKKATVSDDEADYLVQVVQHGPTLKTSRLDERATAMSQLSELDFKHGRASAKTFDMERKLRQEKRNRDNVRRQMRRQNVSTEAELAVVGGPSESSIIPLAPTNLAEDFEEADATTDGNTSATDGDDYDEGSDAESIGAASTSTHHTLRDKKFSIRTRIVDGVIVLDESSLQQSRNDDAGLLNRGETIDINEGDRFVNSATHAKPRVRNDRWTADETTRFLEAVSMWGSDFEMIARMFPLRSRQQIRAKWRSLERTDSRSLDLAFKRRLPIDLEVYGRLAGVDLSGEGPQIELQQEMIVKKGEEEDDSLGPDFRAESAVEQPVILPKEIELDENGLEIVDEGDAQDNVPPIRRATRASKRAHRDFAAGEDGDAGSMPAPAPPIRQLANDADLRAASAQPPSLLSTTNAPRPGRSGSRARSGSTASLAGSMANASVAQSVTSSSAQVAASSAASIRERKQRKAREESRKERERARRRPAPSGEEEILD